MKEHARRWKDITQSQTDRINTVKMALILKAIYRVSAITIKIPMLFFTEIEKSALKFIKKHKRL
jgi:hypothetical protein